MKKKNNPIKNVALKFPCEEDLSKMSEVNGRKKCEKCKNLLYDFSKMNENEYEGIIQNSEKKVCGVYKASQLSEKFLKYAAATFIASSLSSPSEAKNLITYENHDLTILHKNRLLPQFDFKLFKGMVAVVNPKKSFYTRFTRDGNAFPNHEYEEVIAQIKKHLKLDLKLEDKISTIIEFEIGLEGNVLNTSIIKEINKEIEDDILQAINKVDLNFQPSYPGPVSYPFRVYFPFNLFYEDKEK